VTSCFAGQGDSPVLVDHAAEDLAACDRSVQRDDARWIMVRWPLTQALVWPVVIEVSDVLAQDGGGVALVVDQHPVGALFPTLRTNLSA
jgi:hypothetical protein